MCVAAIIHKPVSFESMHCMDTDNPHGAGVAWFADGQLRFKRGLKAEHIYAMQESGEITYPYLMHYRWATHGDRIPELTHPFPTGPRAFAGELEGTAEQVIIHNGVWNDYVNWLEWIDSSVPTEAIMSSSDTGVAAYFYAEFPDIGHQIPWAVASATVKDSPDGAKMEIVKHGGWSVWQGNEYSNLNWLPTKEWWQSEQGGGRRSWRSYAGYGRSNWSSRGGWSWEDVKEDGTDNGWDEYVRWKYGDETADVVQELADSPDDADLMTKLADEDARATALAEILPDHDSDEFDDLVSESPAEVNKWLGQQMAQEYLRANTVTHKHTKCKLCEIWTKSDNGICIHCARFMAEADAEIDTAADKDKEAA